jgi:hypothetical protein
MINLKDRFLFVDEYEGHWNVYWSFSKEGDSAAVGIDKVMYHGNGMSQIFIPAEHLPESLIEDMEFELTLVIEKEIGIDSRNVRMERRK